MPTLILTEKPSVARAIGEALGSPKHGEGYLEVGEYILTWAVGHLIALAPPEAYTDAWKSWNMEQLPMIPDSFKLIVNKKTSKQYKVVKEWLVHPTIEKVIIATDAGAEGELIARRICEKAKVKKPLERLWISSLTNEVILKGMRNLRPAKEFDLLYASAAARARADWIVGLNATRAFTCAARLQDRESTVFTLGRVQTPTLKLIVEREKEIQEFEPETYYEVVGAFQDENGTTYTGTWFNPNGSRIEDQAVAESILAIKGMTTKQVEINLEEMEILPPTFLSLPLLEQKASQKFKLTVAQVDDIAQTLYDRGMITYPRTADQLVTPDVAATFPSILKELGRNGHQEWIPKQIPSLENNSRYVGDVSDHHAIVPTGKDGKVEGKIAQVYDFIVRTFISAHHPPGQDLQQKIVTTVKEHSFLTKETAIQELGWRSVWGATKKGTLTTIQVPVQVEDIEIEEKQTQPPSRFTEASIIKEMEQRHLGTPATRSGILERLKKQNYVIRKDPSLHPTEKAFTLMDGLQDSEIASVSFTAEWEKQLIGIQGGKVAVTEFNQSIDEWTQQFISQVTTASASDPKTPSRGKGTVLGTCPQCKEGQVIRKETQKEKWIYGCNRYAKGCRFFVAGEIGGQTIQDKDIVQLLSKGRTREKNFQFKQGREPAKACLVLNQDGTTSFDFKPRGIVPRLKKLVGLR